MGAPAMVTVSKPRRPEVVEPSPYLSEKGVVVFLKVVESEGR